MNERERSSREEQSAGRRKRRKEKEPKEKETVTVAAHKVHEAYSFRLIPLKYPSIFFFFLLVAEYRTTYSRLVCVCYCVGLKERKPACVCICLGACLCL